MNINLSSLSGNQQIGLNYVSNKLLQSLFSKAQLVARYTRKASPFIAFEYTMFIFSGIIHRILFQWNTMLILIHLSEPNVTA